MAIKNDVTPEWLDLKIGRRNTQEKNSWETLDIETYRINKPTVICLSGNGAVDFKEVNGFCKLAQSYLELLTKNNPKAKDGIDIVGIKYPILDKKNRTGRFAKENIEKIVNNLFVSLAYDENGKVSFDELCRRLSQITFFTYCKGSMEAYKITYELSVRLHEIGFTKEEIKKALNCMWHISYAPYQDDNIMPTIKASSLLDDTVFRIPPDQDMTFDGIKLHYSPELVKKDEYEFYASELLGIYSSKLLNEMDFSPNEHNILYVRRNADWDIMDMPAGSKMIKNQNANAVSQMLAWSLCSAVDNSLRNYKSRRYIPKPSLKTFMKDLLSIKSSFKDDSLKSKY